MSARDDFTTSTKTAEVTKARALDTALAAHHAGIDAVTSTIGYVPGTGNNTNLVAATATANKAKLDALAAAEMAKQAAVSVAKDTLRSTGDRGPM